MIMTFSIDLYSTKRNTFILKCFIQFTCTNLDGSQKMGGNFFYLLQKEVPRKGGFPQRRGGSNPGGNYGLQKNYAKPRGHEHKNPMLPVLQPVCSQCYQCYKQCVPSATSVTSSVLW